APSALTRLAVVALVNGALLSVLALLQLSTSPPDFIYWSFRTEGLVYGPFICRNHFPFYVNVCVGLGLGLLLQASTARTGTAAGGPAGWQERVAALLGGPQVLWVGLGLTLMLVAVALSLSRGGVLSLFAATATCLAVALWLHPGFRWRGAVLLTFAGAAALLAWFGMGRLSANLESLWQGKAAGNRLPLWE